MLGPTRLLRMITERMSSAGEFDLGLLMKFIFSTALSVAASRILESPFSSESIELKMIFRDDFLDFLELSRINAIILGIIPGNLETEIEQVDDLDKLNRVDFTGRTALHWAALKGDANAVHELLKAGADANARGLEQATPLFDAARSRSARCIEALVMGGADRALRQADGYTALHNGLLRNPDDQTNWLKAFITSSIQVRELGLSKWPLVAFCVPNNLIQCMKFLVAFGADIDQTDKEGDTALGEAIVRDRVEFMQVLLDAGARYDQVNASGYTILHMAAACGGLEAVIILTKAKLRDLDPSAKNYRGQTATDLLKQRALLPAGFVEAFEALLSSIRSLNDLDVHHDDGYQALDSRSEYEIFYDAAEI